MTMLNPKGINEGLRGIEMALAERRQLVRQRDATEDFMERLSAKLANVQDLWNLIVTVVAKLVSHS